MYFFLIFICFIYFCIHIFSQTSVRTMNKTLLSKTFEVEVYLTSFYVLIILCLEIQTF